MPASLLSLPAVKTGHAQDNAPTLNRSFSGLWNLDTSLFDLAVERTSHGENHGTVDGNSKAHTQSEGTDSRQNTSWLYDKYLRPAGSSSAEPRSDSGSRNIEPDTVSLSSIRSDDSDTWGALEDDYVFPIQGKLIEQPDTASLSAAFEQPMIHHDEAADPHAVTAYENIYEEIYENESDIAPRSDEPDHGILSSRFVREAWNPVSVEATALNSVLSSNARHSPLSSTRHGTGQQAANSFGTPHPLSDPRRPQL